MSFIHSSSPVQSPALCLLKNYWGAGKLPGTAWKVVLREAEFVKTALPPSSHVEPLLDHSTFYGEGGGKGILPSQRKKPGSHHKNNQLTCSILFEV